MFVFPTVCVIDRVPTLEQSVLDVIRITVKMLLNFFLNHLRSNSVIIYDMHTRKHPPVFFIQTTNER